MTALTALLLARTCPHLAARDAVRASRASDARSEQERLAKLVVEADDQLGFQLGTADGDDPHRALRLVGGLDISFFPSPGAAAQQSSVDPEDLQEPPPSSSSSNAAEPERSIASLVVLNFPVSLSPPPLAWWGWTPEQPPCAWRPAPDLDSSTPLGERLRTLSVVWPHPRPHAPAPATRAPQELQVVYEDHAPLPLSVPYVPGYLAFREVPAFTALLDRLRQAHGDTWWPQVPTSITRGYPLSGVSEWRPRILDEAHAPVHPTTCAGVAGGWLRRAAPARAGLSQPPGGGG